MDFLADRDLVARQRIVTSPLQTLPFARHWFRATLGIMPIMMEQ